MKSYGLLALNVLVVVNNWRSVFCIASQCTINGRKAVHTVDDRFLSISIDPAVLFSGIKFNSASLNLAKHLAPAYIRVAGPSTSYIKFSDDDKAITGRANEDSKYLVFGPAMWWSMNQWMKTFNFTPVFALGDGDRIEDNWDPKAVLGLLDLSAKMNVNCYWQLGYDCTGRSEEQYLRDLKSLRKILDAFPGKKHTWKTVGSDLSECALGAHKEISRKFIEDLEDVDAVMWEPQEEGISFADDPMHRFLGIYQPNLPIWSSAPKDEHPISFSAAIDWAYRIGESARNGFDVVFRQPRLQELFGDTPVYWVTLLHKTLMGRNVFDVKTSTSGPQEAHVYAHCSRNQNSYSIRGAMTVMVVNNGSDEHTTSMKVAGTQLKSVDVRSYILTAGKENSMETILNGQQLLPKILNQDRPIFTPKLRRAKATTHLTLTVPPKSIGFFVLPGARIPICLVDEDETDLILEEISRDQKIEFPEAKPTNLRARINARKPTNSLSDLFQRLEQEMSEDETFYKKLKLKPLLKKDIVESVKQDNTHKQREWKPLLFNESKLNDIKNLIDKTLDIKKVDFKNLLKKEDAKPKLDVGMTSAEIIKVLADRAKAKVDMRIGLANSELGGAIENAKIRTRRDINMGLLKEKTDVSKPKKFNSMFHALQKEATIRKPGETSDELLADEFESPVEEKRPSKIYAGFASEEDEAEGMPGLPMRPAKEILFPNLQPRKDKFSLEPHHALSKFNLPLLPALNLFPTKTLATTQKPKQKKKNFVDYVKDDEGDDVDEFSDFGGDTGYHTFHEVFGGDIVPIKSRIKPQRNRELWEFDGFGKSKESKGDLLESEFIINNGDKEEVGKSIKRLEDYFNKPVARQDGDFESSFGRFKRDLSKFKHGDLYERIRDNMEDLKAELHKRREKNQLTGLHGREAFKDICSKHPFKRLNARSNVPESSAKDEGKYEHQIQFLKNRLAHRKKLAEGQKILPGDLQRKFKERIDLSNRLRRVRSAKNTYDISYDHLYVPTPTVNLSEHTAATYESKLDKIKEWKPEDILKLPKIYYTIDQIQVGKEKESDTLEHSNSLMKGIKKRHIITDPLNNAIINRRVISDIVENDIEDYRNEIIKDVTFFKPSNEESGEYTLVLPTKDSISLIRKDGDTELKIHTSRHATVDPNTCPASDFTSESAVAASSVITINDDYEETTLVADDDVSEASTSNGTQVLSTQSVEYNKDFFNNLLKSVNNFIDKIHKKISIIF